METYILTILVLIVVNIIAAISLNLINGITGQFSLGHAGFMAVGAYASAIIVKNYDMPIEMGIMFGAVFAAAAGFAVGFPVLRLKGDYLAIVTLGFGEIIRIVINNLRITGGASGFPGIAGLKGILGNTEAVILCILSIIVIRNIIKSSDGRAFISIREDEIAAESMGINITKYKVLAFVIGAFFAGIAGAIYGHSIQFLDPKDFDLFRSVDILLMVVLGGMGSLSGSVIAAVILTILSEMLRGLGEYRMIFYSLMLIILMLARPNGIFGKRELSDLLPFKKRGVE